jgi:hypothetical protein
MEKQFDKNDHIARKFVKEAGLERPPANFTQNVMDAIGKERHASTVYKPLLSLQAWTLVAALFVVAVGVLYFTPVTLIDTAQVKTVLTSWNVSMPEIHLSNTFLYGIAFLSLFLVQIPFLKNFTAQSKA